TRARDRPPAVPRSASSVPAAVRLDDLAVDPRALRAREERHHARDVLGVAETAQRDLLGPPLDALLGAAVPQELRIDRPGGDGVDGDAPRAEFLRKNVRHRLDRGL